MNNGSMFSDLCKYESEDFYQEHKSVRGDLRTGQLEQENKDLRSKLRRYEEIIDRNSLWAYFSRHRGKTHMRDDAR